METSLGFLGQESILHKNYVKSLIHTDKPYKLVHANTNLDSISYVVFQNEEVEEKVQIPFDKVLLLPGSSYKDTSARSVFDLYLQSNIEQGETLNSIRIDHKLLPSSFVNVKSIISQDLNSLARYFQTEVEVQKWIQPTPYQALLLASLGGIQIQIQTNWSYQAKAKYGFYFNTQFLSYDFPANKCTKSNLSEREQDVYDKVVSEEWEFDFYNQLIDVNLFSKEPLKSIF